MKRLEEFIALVAKMREAQKDYQEHRTRANESLMRKCETLVDEWLIEYTAEKVQLELWSIAAKTDETPGAYNVTHGDEEKETEAT